MTQFLFIFLIFFSSINYSKSTLVDGIVTLSWESNGLSPVVDRFLSNQTKVHFKITCQELPSNQSDNQQTDGNKNAKATDFSHVKVQISGRIGRFVKCLPLQSDTFMTTNQLVTKSDKDSRLSYLDYYKELWDEMEVREFILDAVECGYSGEVYYDEYSGLQPPKVSPDEALKLRKKFFERTSANTKDKRSSQIVRRAVNSTTIDANKPKERIVQTWADGYYFIEISKPNFPDTSSVQLDVDVIVAMKNRHGGYLTADEYPALVFYGVMCALYALFALLWFIWCAFYWRELLKIQFWIGGVILLGMIEKSAFLAEYDTLNRHGYKVHVAIVTAEVLSCLKRAVSRMLVIVVAVGYGIVKPRLGSLKQKILGIGLLYFGLAATESLLRLNTKNDEASSKVFMARIPLAIVDATIYYWIFTSLVATARTLRLRNNVVKLNVYRHFTNTILFAIVSSLLFMIWSLKSHLFTTCITDWKEFWVDDAFWHILFSLILFVILFLFRPSNNNQRYAFVPLLDQSDNEDNDEFNDDEKETAVFDSITMRKTSGTENSSAQKARKQQGFLNRESNVANGGNQDADDTNAVEDALTWVENNIPTAIADQALQALDDEDEIVNTKLERSKMQ